MLRSVISPSPFPPLLSSLDAGGKPPPIIVDLSADYRFHCASGTTGKGEVLDGWVYGCPETNRDALCLPETQKIANPGCYATGAQMGLLPLLDVMAPSTTPNIFGVSGYERRRRRKMKEKMSACRLFIGVFVILFDNSISFTTFSAGCDSHVY